MLGAKMGDAVIQHHRNSGVPLEIIGPGALSAMAVACQNLLDVRRPNCSPSPTSLYMMVVAETGKGKDFGAAPFFSPILKYQARAEKEYKSEIEEFRKENRVWNLREMKVLKSLASVGLGCDDSDLLNELRQIDESRPMLPKAPKVITSDTTSGAIVESLCTRWPATCSFTMEGGSFLNGMQGRSLPFFNDAWGGQSLSRDRVGKKNISIENPRLSLVISIQYAPLNRFLKRLGADGHEIGFLQRILLSCVDPFIPNVYITGEKKETNLIEICSERCEELLMESEVAGYGDCERKVLEFSAGASLMYVDILNYFRSQSNLGQRYQSIAGYAVKAPENIARIAAILHKVDNLLGTISEHTLQRAYIIGHWHVEQFFAMYSDTAIESKDMRDSNRLMDVLQYARCMGNAVIPKTDLDFWCPPDLQGRKLKAALHGLIGNGLAGITKSKHGTFVYLTHPGQLIYSGATWPESQHAAHPPASAAR